MAKAKPKHKSKGEPKTRAQRMAEKLSPYLKQYDNIARNMVQFMGATVSEVAQVLGVSRTSIYRWQATHPSFRAALVMPEAIANARVSLSLYNEAVGYYVDEEEIRIIDGKPVTLKKKTWMRPQLGAIVWHQKTKGDVGEYGMRPPPQPLLPVDDGAITLDNSGNPETDRQVARRVLFIQTLARLEDEAMQ